MISMTNNGDPLENAIAERINGILKTELISSYYNDIDAASYTSPDASPSITTAEDTAALTGRYQQKYTSKKDLK